MPVGRPGEPHLKPHSRLTLTSPSPHPHAHPRQASNQERYTGYAGRAATRVWETIYNDLCFHPEREGKSFEVTRETVKEMCFEKRAFYRVVSGLHASIAVHLTSRYPQGEGSWGRRL